MQCIPPFFRILVQDKNAWWHQAITWTNVDWSSVRSCGNHLWVISQEMHKIFILDMSLKITDLRLQSHSSGTKELPNMTSILFQVVDSRAVIYMLWPNLFMARSFVCQIFTKHSHVRARYEVSFVNSQSDLSCTCQRRMICNVSWWTHYSDVIMSTMSSQITGVSIVYSTVFSGADQRRHQSSAPLAFARGIHRWPMNSPHKGPITWNMFSFSDVIMCVVNGFHYVSMFVMLHPYELFSSFHICALSNDCICHAHFVPNYD